VIPGWPPSAISDGHQGPREAISRSCGADTPAFGLNTLTGVAVLTGDEQTGNIFARAVDVLRDPAVAGAFGLSAPADHEWPLENQNYDGTGA
jgi:hypothetical protein